MFPLLIPALTAALHRLLRQRGLPGTGVLPRIGGLLTFAGLLVSGSGTFGLSLWRPVELYGVGLRFRLDSTVLPYTLLAAAVSVGTARSARSAERRLLRLSILLAAISADNLLALVLLWSLLAVWSNWNRSNGWQLAGVAPLFAAAAVAGGTTGLLSAGALVGLAALLLARGADRPYLEALPALALLSRFGAGGAAVLLLGAGAVVIGTLAAERWLPAGLVGFGLLAAGLRPEAAGAAEVAGAIALVVAGSSGWGKRPARAWTAAVVVGGLPLLVSSLSPIGAPGLILIPAAALLAAPILAQRQQPEDQPTLDPLDRWAAAFPLAVCLAVAIWRVQTLSLLAAAHAAAALGLALLMAAGPRWLYRQPAYAAMAARSLRILRGGLQLLTERLLWLVRGINGVLEGEGSTVWLFVILLIIAQGLAG